MTKLYPLIRLKYGRFLLALFLLLVSFFSEASALTYTTKQSGNFSDASTWVSGTVPAALDRIVVEQGHILTINVDTPVLNMLHINPGGEIRGDGTGKVLSLGSTPGHDLKNFGMINFSGSYAATIKIENDGKWDGSGIYNLTDLDLNGKALSFTSNGKYTINLSGARPILHPGTIDGKSMILFRFNGTEAQTLLSSAGIRYGEIEIANPAGVYLEGDLTTNNLMTHLTLARGFLHMNGYQIHGRPGASLDRQTLTLGPGTSLIVDGASAFPDNFYSYVLDPTSTVRYSGGHSQTIKALNYGNLQITGERGGQTVTFASATIGVSGQLAADATFTSGKYAAGTSILRLNGANNQAIELEKQALQLHGLVISGGGTKRLAGGQDLLVKNLLLQEGLLETSLSTAVKILPGGTVSGASQKSYVSGNLAKQVPLGLQVAMTYEIGDTTGYHPLTFTFPAVASSGVITAGIFSAATGDQGGSRIKPENRVNKTWKITNEGLAPAIYSTTFRFSEQELAGDDVTDFEANIFSPAAYQRIQLSDLSSTSVSVTNASAFGYLQIGDYNEVVVNAKIFLQGPYAGGKKMRANLLNVLPLSQPFAAIYNYAGNETVAPALLDIPNPAVDWVLLELRSETDGRTVIARKACLLREDGQLVEADGSSAPTFLDQRAGNYYIVIRHRNHLAVMSAQPLALHDEPLLYDFSTHPDQYFGGEAALLEPGVYGLFGGDSNGSDFITITDFLPVNYFLNRTGYLPGDLNLSGVITSADRLLITRNYYKYCRVP